MSISQDLFMAILAMDSYNRGYSAGIGDGVNLDASGNDIDGLGGVNSQVGTATVIANDNSPAAQAAGFYAVAYDTQFGTAISYRGTDNLSVLQALGSDIIQGWVNATGTLTDQTDQAVAFYEAVSQQSVYAQTAPQNVIVTGHSLGGPLAA